MAIEREYFDGPITFICDICGEEDNTHCQGFNGALAKFKSHGGVAKNIKGEWEHHCVKCKD